MPKLVIAMPAYRAEQTLERTVADIPATLDHELILVDDASPDGTVQVARDLGITHFVHPTNRGYGGNQKTCYREALNRDAEIVVLLHPDYQYDPKAVPLLIAPILAGDADLTFGSRFAGLGDPLGGGMPLYRFAGNRVTTVLENLMLGSRFTEMHSGMRAYSRRCLLALPFGGYSNDFDFDSQMLVDAVTLGLRVVEVPIPTRYTKESSSIAIGPSFRYIARSLEYCARRAAERGRRGRRSPMPRRLAPFAPAAPAAAGVAPSAVLRIADEWFVRENRLAAAGDGTERLLKAAVDRGWQASALDLAGSNDQQADVAVLLGVLERTADPIATLRRARDAMHPEGMLLAVSAAGRLVVPPPAFAAALDRAGFALLDWRKRPGGAVVAVARLR